MTIIRITEPWSHFHGCLGWVSELHADHVIVVVFGEDRPLRFGRLTFELVPQ